MKQLVRTSSLAALAIVVVHRAGAIRRHESHFTYACVGRNRHVALTASSTHATEDAVKTLLKAVFRLD
jgi:molybdopterin synthase catalytic subunit